MCRTWRGAPARQPRSRGAGAIRNGSRPATDQPHGSASSPMSIFGIVLKSLRQHLLSTLVTAFSIALAGGLLMSVWVVKEQSRAAFTQMDGGFDAVLGAR